jgi:hypothetical protein
MPFIIIFFLFCLLLGFLPIIFIAYCRAACTMANKILVFCSSRFWPLPQATYAHPDATRPLVLLVRYCQPASQPAGQLPASQLPASQPQPQPASQPASCSRSQPARPASQAASDTHAHSPPSPPPRLQSARRTGRRTGCRSPPPRPRSSSLVTASHGYSQPAIGQLAMVTTCLWGCTTLLVWLPVSNRVLAADPITQPLAPPSKIQVRPGRSRSNGRLKVRSGTFG